MSTAFPPLRLAWTIWGLGAALYLVGFFQRVAPGVMGAELMHSFSVGAAGLGNLSAFYFYSYVAMQIPTGLLADTWGPRRLLTAGSLTATAGGLLFALAPQFWLAGLGRALVGASVAVAFVCMMKLASHWMPARHFAFATGSALFVGIAGAVLAGVPLDVLVSVVGWRAVMAGVALITAALAVAMWWLVRDDPAERGYQSHATEHADDGRGSGALQTLLTVLRYRNTWLLTLAPGGVAGPVLAFAGLWGVPFLVTHYEVSETTAAAYCTAMLIAWALGGPALGALSDRIGRRRPLYVAGLAVASLCWAVVILLPALPTLALGALLTLAGFASGCMIIGFAYAKESLPGKYGGTVGGVVNMGVMLGPMVLQPAIGLVLDGLWDGTTEEGLRIYSLGAYRAGFLLMLAWAIAGTILVAFSRETHCRQTP
ncbi:MFS transporter [Arhodomonas sp. SL1]|uniref:MFS transporter n=1 Tax=Arhodomonas sp. SL1 TaxID=3425691 RepID=UPI003F883A1C